MQRFINKWVVFLSSECGASGLEYAVLLGLIVSATAAGIIITGKNAQTAMQTASSGAGGSKSTSSLGTSSTTSTPTPSTPTPVTVFADTFSNSKTSAAKWDLNGSWWQVTDGGLQAGPVNGWNGLEAYALGSSFSDGTVSMNATLNTGWGYGLMFDLSSDPVKGNFNGYSFQYDEGYGSGAFTLHKWVNGVEIQPPLAVDFPASNYQWYGVPRTITVARQGALITCSVDGQAVISLSDSSYRSGGVGLRLWNNPGATFSNFSVTSK